MPLEQQHSATARMAKLVDAWDLKSPARKGVPVRFRLRAPYIKGLHDITHAGPSFYFRNQKILRNGDRQSHRRGNLHPIASAEAMAAAECWVSIQSR